MSPHQIRQQAALAFRRRCRASITVKIEAKPLRFADSDETPLSHAEITFGIQRGLICQPKFMGGK